MQILIKAYPGDQYDGAECALITIDQPLAKKIAAARKQLLALRDNPDFGETLQNLCLEDLSARYFADWRLGGLTFEQRQLFDSEEPVVLADPLALQRLNEETDEDLFEWVCEQQLVIGEDHFKWDAFVDDSCFTYVTTGGLPYDILSRVL